MPDGGGVSGPYDLGGVISGVRGPGQESLAGVCAGVGLGIASACSRRSSLSELTGLDASFPIFRTEYNGE